jgi:hypothetical protein
MLELFHAIGDPGSARARQLFVARDLGRRVRLRNIVYPEVVADFTARGGRELPALWDGARLIQGADAVAEALAQL